MKNPNELHYGAVTKGPYALVKEKMLPMVMFTCFEKMQGCTGLLAASQIFESYYRLLQASMVLSTALVVINIQVSTSHNLIQQLGTTRYLCVSAMVLIAAGVFTLINAWNSNKMKVVAAKILPFRKALIELAAFFPCLDLLKKHRPRISLEIKEEELASMLNAELLTKIKQPPEFDSVKQRNAYGQLVYAMREAAAKFVPIRQEVQDAWPYWAEE